MLDALGRIQFLLFKSNLQHHFYEISKQYQPLIFNDYLLHIAIILL